MINLWILGAVIAHVVIANINALAGAITGFVLTTVVLVWALSVYADGVGIAFFGLSVSRAVFIGLIVLWYVFDGVALKRALDARRR